MILSRINVKYWFTDVKFNIVTTKHGFKPLELAEVKLTANCYSANFLLVC